MNQNSTFVSLLVLLVVASASAVREVQFVSPLQSLTIPDPEHVEKQSKASSDDELQMGILETPRRRFLPRFLAGLQAENTVREQIAMGQISTDDGSDDGLEVSGKDWVGKTKAAEERRRRKEDAIIEQGYDAAMAQYDAQTASAVTPKSENPNKFQFVGLLDRTNPKKPITWHARPKPAGAKWSVRLVHVNKDAVVKDLFNQGKVDIFAKYTNTGKFQVKGEGDAAKQTNIPIVTSKYEVRERSIK